MPSVGFDQIQISYVALQCEMLVQNQKTYYPFMLNQIPMSCALYLYPKICLRKIREKVSLQFLKKGIQNMYHFYPLKAVKYVYNDRIKNKFLMPNGSALTPCVCLCKTRKMYEICELMADGTWQTQRDAIKPLNLWPKGLTTHNSTRLSQVRRDRRNSVYV